MKWLAEEVKMLKKIVIPLLFVIWVMPAWSADMKLIYNKGEIPYHIAMFKEALEHTKDMGGYELKSADVTFSTPRQIDEVADDTGSVSFLVRSPSILDKGLQRLTPIKIPLDKGLLGYRVLIARKQDLSKLAAINSLEELQKLKFGQGSRWVSVDVLTKAGFNVVRGYYAKGLLRMLDEERFDVFPRAIWEAPKELADAEKELPGLVLEPTLVLHFPYASYFWVSQKGSGPELAKRIETGLRRMMADGSFDRIFNENYGAFIETTKLRSRKVFEVNNALLPTDTPLADSALWFKMNPSETPAKPAKKK